MKDRNLTVGAGKSSHQARSRRSKLLAAVGAVAGGLLVASAAQADLFWDRDGATAGGSGNTVAPGTWGVSDFWSTSSAGDVATGPWVSGENAFFSAGTDVTGTYTVTVSGAQTVGNLNVQEGVVTFSGGELVLNGGGIVTTTNTTINSLISGSAGLTKTGAGSLTLSAANTYSGTTTVTTGRLIVTNGGALGTGDVTFAPASATAAYTGQLFLQGGITVSNNVIITNSSRTAAPIGQLESNSGNNVLTGNVNVASIGNNIDNGISSIGVSSGSLTITGLVQPGGTATSTWAKVGAGTLVLSGDSPNTYGGLTRVFGGYLIAEKNGAFGTSAGGVFMLATAPFTQTVGLRAPASSPDGFDYSIAETGNGGMSLAGFSNSNLEEGLFHNFSGHNKFAGSVRLDNVTQSFTVPIPIGVATNSSLTISGPVANAPANTSLRNVTKIGGGALTFQGANTHIGSLIINNGSIAYGGPFSSGGTWIPSGPAPSFAQVGPSGKLIFDNHEFVNTSRFINNPGGPLIPVNIDSGNFELIGNAGQDTFQGTISGGLNAIGDASFTVTNPSSTLPPEQPRFTTSLGIAPVDPNPVVGGINRSGRGTMLLRGNDLGTAATGVSQIFLDPTLSAPVGEAGGTGTKVGILPFATGDASGTAAGASGFVTYGANGVRHLDEATEYATGITSGSSDLVNASISAPTTVLTDTAVNSIRMTPTSSIVIGDLATLSVNSGAILNTNTDATSIRDGTLNFGAAEGVITTNGDLNISSVITGSNGVTKSGRGTLTLSSDSTFAGPLTLNGGNLVFSSDTQLGPVPAGATNGALVLAGGTLKPQGTMTLNANRGVTLGSAYAGVEVATGETLMIDGIIDGTGTLNKNGPGTLVLTASNSHTGGFTFNEGMVSISNDAQLGSTAIGGTNGILTFNGGTLRVTGSTTINTNRGVYITSRGATIDVAAGQEVVAPLYTAGPGNLTKSGDGTLVLSGFTAQSTFIGLLSVEGGTLAYQGTNGLGFNPPFLVPNYWTISNGATLQNRANTTTNAGLGAANRGITIVGAATLNNDTGLSWYLSQPITGTGTLTKTGGGEMRLTVASTYNGKTTVTGGGILAINADNRLGAVVTAADALTIDGSTFGTLTPATGTTTFTLNANRGVVIANNATIRGAASTTMTIAGVISGDGSLTKTDVGTIILSGANTYTGPTTIEAGLLRVNGTNSGGGAFTIRSGATLGGTGTILSDVTSESGGHINPGTTVGTLTMNGLSLDTSALDIDGNATGFDRVNITSDDKFTLTGTSSVNVTDLGGATAGEYVIVDYAGAPLADISGLALSSSSVGSFTLSLFHDTANTQVKLRVGAGGPPQWNVDSDGNWSDASNWSTFIPPNGPADIANFLGKITAPRTVILDTDKTVNAVNFDNANTYTIAPTASARLTVTGGGATITAAQGTHVISAPVVLTDSTTIEPRAGSAIRLEGGLAVNAGATISKRGGGVLAIAGANAIGSNTTLQAAEGSINLNSDAGTPASAAAAAVANLSLNIGAGSGAASVVLGSHQQLKELRVQHSDADLQGLDLASPAVAGAYNGVRVYAADLDATKAALWGAILNARTTPGDGIFDSGLHANSGIGVAIITDEHGDKAVGVRSTRTGDLNLDGTVTIADFIDLASNFGSMGTATWQEGDVNYDQNVTIADFIDLAANFNGTYSGGIGGEDYQLLASFASSIGVDPSVIGSAVPEPGTLSVLAIGALGLMGRRRRK